MSEQCLNDWLDGYRWDADIVHGLVALGADPHGAGSGRLAEASGRPLPTTLDWAYEIGCAEATCAMLDELAVRGILPMRYMDDEAARAANVHEHTFFSGILVRGGTAIRQAVLAHMAATGIPAAWGRAVAQEFRRSNTDRFDTEPAFMDIDYEAWETARCEWMLLALAECDATGWDYLLRRGPRAGAMPESFCLPVGAADTALQLAGVRRVLAAGVHPDAIHVELNATRQACTMLQAAALYGHAPMAQFLLENGADPSLRNAAAAKPRNAENCVAALDSYEIARKFGCVSVIEVLAAHRARSAIGAVLAASHAAPATPGRRAP